MNRDRLREMLLTNHYSYCWTTESFYIDPYVSNFEVYLLIATDISLGVSSTMEDSMERQCD